MKRIWESVLISKPLVVFILLLMALQVEAKLLVKPSEAITKFIGQTKYDIQEKSLLLTKDELLEVRKLSRTPCEDGLFKYFILKNQDRTYFVPLITHRVRSKTQTSAVFINAQGVVEHVEIIAFNEPPKYTPQSSLLNQFKGKSLSDKMQPHKDITFISGATLTADATSKSIRIALALWHLKKPTGASK